MICTLVGNKHSCHRSDNRPICWRDTSLIVSFSLTVHLNQVEDIHAEMLQPWLRRRSTFVILVGGKSPCHNCTSHQLHQLARLVQDFTNLPNLQDASTQVVGWLETTSIAPDEVKRQYDELLGAQHFKIAASDFGWVRQYRTVRFQNSSHGFEANPGASPDMYPRATCKRVCPPFTFSQRSSCMSWIVRPPHTVGVQMVSVSCLRPTKTPSSAERLGCPLAFHHHPF